MEESVASATASPKNTGTSEAPYGHLFSEVEGVNNLDLVNDVVYKVGRVSRGDNKLHCELVQAYRQNKLSRTSVGQVSNHHFDIIRDGGQTYVVDRSLHGTYINDDPDGREPGSRWRVDDTDPSAKEFEEDRPIGKGNRRLIVDNDRVRLGKGTKHLFTYRDAVFSAASQRARFPRSCREHYVITPKLLGRGGFGTVHLAYDITGTQQYAIKVIHKKPATKTKATIVDLCSVSSRSSSNFVNRRIPGRFVRRELEVLRAVRHPCCIGMQEVFHSRDTVFVVMNHMAGGNLADRMFEHALLYGEIGGFQEDLAKFYALQLLNAVNYLHSMEIMHRDLKPENCLLAGVDDYTLLKVSDFGLSRTLSAGSVASTHCGTRSFTAPEVYAGSYTAAVDLFSVGHLIYYMLTGQSARDDSERSGFVPVARALANDCSEEARELVCELMREDYDVRPTANVALKHSWLDDSVVKGKVENVIINQPNKHNYLNPPLPPVGCRKRDRIASAEDDKENNMVSQVVVVRPKPCFRARPRLALQSTTTSSNTSDHKKSNINAFTDEYSLKKRARIEAIC